jgi:oligopeptide transport system substrate-binding protein
MYRTLLGILAAFAVALVLVGLSFSAASETPADFRFNNGTEPPTLDPGLMKGQPEGRIADAIFEGLTYREAKTLEPKPGMAERWDVSDDERTYTFHIRRGAVWSDGTPVTAHDFVYAWRRLQDPKLGAEYAYILHMVKWAEIYNTYSGQADMLLGTVDEEGNRTAGIAEGVEALAEAGSVEGPAWQRFLDERHASEALKNVQDDELRDALAHREGPLDADRLRAIARAMRAEAERRRASHAQAVAHFGVDQGVWAEDDHTLKVELNSPTPYFLEITAFYPALPVPRWVVEAEGNALDWFMPEKIVTNGPYLLESWRPYDKIRLVRNPRYWGADEVRLGIIDAYPIENATTALNLYLQGELDWTTTYPRDIVETLKKRPDEFLTNTGFIVYYFRFNCTRPQLNDARVRRAICMAIDRTAIVEHITRLGEVPAFHLVPPMPGYEPPESGIRFDPEAARALLREAGVDPATLGGADGLGILYNEHPVHTKIAEAIAEQLHVNLGIPRERMTAYNQEWQAYMANTRELQYDIARAGWIGDYLDPNTFLDLWVTNGGNNQTGWGDAHYDRLIHIARDVSPLVDDPEQVLAWLKEPDRARALIDAARAAEAGRPRIEARERLRMHVLREAEAILLQDGFPIMPVYFYVVSALVKPHVKGFYAQLEFPDGSRKPNLQDLHPLRDLWVERATASESR